MSPAATFAGPMRSAPLLAFLLLMPACTAELKEQNNELEAQVRMLQSELEASETSRGRLALDLRDLQTRMTRLEAAEKFGFDLQRPLWAVLHTSMGELVCELYPAEAPATVDNFVRLAEGRKEWFDPAVKAHVTRKLYDGTVFHRVLKDTVIQGGSPTADSGFSPGYSFADEIHPDRGVAQGALCMANSGPKTNGTQFFVAAKDLPALNGKHTVFGSCEPSDVVLDISNVPTQDVDPERPADPPVLERVTIHRGERPHPAKTP